MRRFNLTNGDGIKLDLSRQNLFLHAPSGLGYEMEAKYLAAGYSFIRTDIRLKQKTVDGQMVFRSYASYQEFVSFISREPLVLGYAPGSRWYYARCQVAALEKTEKANSNLLVCPITFTLMETWREPLTVRHTTEAEFEGKRYRYTYPYRYMETTTGSVIIENGDLESPCTLHIMGPCTNPSWALHQAGRQVMVGRIWAEIPAGHKLVVNADPAAMEIMEKTRSNVSVQNRYRNSDFSTGRFVYAPPGISILSVTHEGTGSIQTYLEVSRIANSV